MARPATRAAKLRLWLGCIGALAASATILGAATAGSRAGSGNLTNSCVETFDASRDYFPDKVTVEDATNFTVSYHRSYKVIAVREAYAGGPAERYVLAQCGTPPPRLEGDLAGAQIVRVPITSLFSASTTHLPLLVDLGRLDVLTGVARLDHLVGDEILERASTGKVRGFAPTLAIDAELVVSSRPSLLMTGGSSSAALAVIRSAGIAVVGNTEWLETTALARAEWLKYMALFLNEERAAQRHYTAMKGRYRALSARATSLPETAKPLVMAGRGTRGDFVIAGGRSYVAVLIRDAGGRYVWAENTSAGAPTMDLETQIRRAVDADIWINGGGWRDLAAMVEDEPRYAEFKAYRQAQVWVYERRVTPTGGNDYWSRSVSHPDLVLADLVKIFHPSLLPNHAFEWYMQVPARKP